MRLCQSGSRPAPSRSATTTKRGLLEAGVAVIDAAEGPVPARLLNATAVKLDRRRARRTGMYELVVLEPRWGDAIRISAARFETMLDRQQRRPVCFIRWSGPPDTTAPSPDLPALWRYLGSWYLASGDATAEAVLDAADERTGATRLRHDPAATPDRLPGERQTVPQTSAAFSVPYVGRLARRSLVAELTDHARRERLDVWVDTRSRLFSVALTVTVAGDAAAMERFGWCLDALVRRYSIAASLRCS